MRDMNSNRRTELAGFLRARRARLSPRQAGLPEAGTPNRRRTPGLRRQEVAQLAGLSVDYYIRLEQARGPHPSRQVLTALARALMLTADERDYLFRMAGQAPPAAPRPSREMSPGIRHLLDSMPGIPAYVVDAAYNVLAWNRLATHFIGDLSQYEDRNMIRWTFLRAPQEVVWSDADFVRFTRSTVADLRAAYARYPGDPGIDSLVTEPLALSPRCAGRCSSTSTTPSSLAHWSSSARCCTSPRPASASSPTVPPPARPPRLPSPNWPTAPRCPARRAPTAVRP